MPKINIPIGENGSKDYSAEVIKLNELTMNASRTTTGTASFTSKSSGIYYTTDDYPDDADVYNKGDIGMICLLRKLYGGADGWLMMAGDLNGKQEQVFSEKILLSAEGWSGNESPYRQAFSSQYIDANTRIDLFVDNDLYVQMINDKVIAIYAENNDGVASVVAIGNKPSIDVTIQADYVKITNKEN